MGPQVFGETANGDTVHSIEIGAGALTARVLTLGAVLQDLRLAPLPHSLTLGSPDIRAYEGSYFSFGSICGPVANRVRGASAVIDGVEHRLSPNLPGGHMLHSGAAGLHAKIWQIEDHGPAHVTLSCTANHGEGGFPGNRRWRVTFHAAAPGALTLSITAETDAATLMNTVNHSYWNLTGAPTHHGQSLQVTADHYLPVDEDFIPTGAVVDVTGTGFDFRKGQVLTEETSIDHNLCLGTKRGPLRDIARLTVPDGLSMHLASTEPGLQVYDGRYIEPEFMGHGGLPYGPRAGLALEPQFWPNAAHEPGFPSTLLRPGETWEQVNRFTFHMP
ncbi:galactose mutarotase [Alphaproteobacteria bacterium KMM 3653]|uniref:Galactose mutarotase n=1 Tax=Harenicola maris TaxID=2841044 RepID=A0AAP2G906_9RHOB|nr:galactose mutarotase [Harenicola maris]